MNACAVWYRGFTLIELLVAMAVAAILMGLAAPSLSSIYRSWQVLQAISAMESTLLLARSEAVRRGGRVALERLVPAGGPCTALAAARWDCGWFVFVDSNANGQWDASEPRLREVALVPGLQIRNALDAQALALNRHGLLSRVQQADTQLFSFAPLQQGSAVSAQTRVLCMGTTGVMRSLRAQECS